MVNVITKQLSRSNSMPVRLIEPEKTTIARTSSGDGSVKSADRMRSLSKSMHMPATFTETAKPTIERASSGDELATQPEWQLHNQRPAPSDRRQVVVPIESGICEQVISSPEDELVISIREKLHHVEGSWAQPSICRVPHYLKQSDDKAYVPKVVSLGPYHRGSARLLKMDRHKWRCLQQILNRTKQGVKMYVDSIRGLEAMARACYEEPINLSIDEFVEMLVLDGCFVLELLQGTARGFEKLGYPPNHPIFAMPASMHSIQRDMIMLENQLPLFVLDHLLRLQLGDLYQKGQVAKLALRFFDPLIPTDEPLTQSDKNKLEYSRGDANISRPSSDQGDLHCLDVFRRSLLATAPPSQRRNGIKEWSHANGVVDKRRQQLIHCVTELRKAGVRFRKRNSYRFWDIEFKDGVLWIPRLVVEDGTRSLFLNLIAFEQSHLPYYSNHITSYMILMDNLINSAEDVRYLHHRGIIEHWLGSDAEVAVLFNGLCEEVVFDIKDSYLSKLSEDVNRYYRNRWNTWCASLKQTYFKNPWAIISLVAAVVLLLLTFGQTFYTVYAYYRPRHS